MNMVIFAPEIKPKVRVRNRDEMAKSNNEGFSRK
jgi:hypothetical protein